MAEVEAPKRRSKKVEFLFRVIARYRRENYELRRLGSLALHDAKNGPELRAFIDKLDAEDVKTWKALIEQPEETTPTGSVPG